jgi:site-specific recombinase XerD
MARRRTTLTWQTYFSHRTLIAQKSRSRHFRRTFATESVRNGLNVFSVQSLLGHSSLTVSSEDAIKAYKPIVT